MEEYCRDVAGNKTDLASRSTGSAVSDGAALDIIDELAAVGIPIS
jgi:hypothetical protein